jgi:probable HAF family extracellular repeat protein
VLLSSVPSARGQCEYEVAVIRHPPCPPPLGYPPIDGLGLNELGHVVGEHWACDWDEDHAFVWTPESGLVTLDMPPGTYTSTAYDINEASQIVGELSITGDDLGILGFLRDGDTVTTLGTMPGGTFSTAQAINSAAQVTGYWGNNVTGPIHGFLWQDGVMSDLSPLVGTAYSHAYAINESGDVAGWMGSSSSDARAFILRGESLIELPPVPGGDTSIAQVLNNRGDAAGRGRYTDPDSGETFPRAFAWVDGAMVRIDPLPGLSRSAARGINDAKQVVGYAWEASTLRGFIWQNGILSDLNDLIPPEFYVNLANGINNAGQIIASGAYNVESAALLLTPINQPPGDLDHDCTVGVTDFLILLDAWGTCPTTGVCPADIDSDGMVGVTDFLLMLAHWG